MQEQSEQVHIILNKSLLNKQCFDSRTYENSKKENNTSQNGTSQNEKIPKKSIDFLPKKINIEKIDKTLEVYRKYTMENELIIKDFTPHLRPIKMHVVPSKLCLNKKGFKDLKCNKENKILLNSNKYFISCPNLEDEDDYDNNGKDKNTFESSNDIISLNLNKCNNNNISYIDEGKTVLDIKEIRKNLQKTKHRNIQKIYSKNNIVKGNYNKCLNAGDSTESDLYDIDEIDDYSLMEYEKNDGNKNENVDDKENNKNNRNRTHSFSILEMLKKKYECENE